MLSLRDIRAYIATLDLADDERIYIGKLDNKKDKSIGVYSRSGSGSPVTAIGGTACGSYDTKQVALLVHWNKSKDEGEQAAWELFDRLREARPGVISSTQVQFIRLMVPEPQDVGTDDKGIYEYVIWVDFIFNKEG